MFALRQSANSSLAFNHPGLQNNNVNLSLNLNNLSSLKNTSHQGHNHQNSQSLFYQDQSFPNQQYPSQNQQYQYQQQQHQQQYGVQDPQQLLFTRIDVSFAERIVPLLDGCTFYKKFSSRQSLNENAFDPLNADKFPPEQCGYGIRFFQLDKSLGQINVRQSLKNGIEAIISMGEIVKPILPQTTMDIIRAQKQFQLQQQQHQQLRKSSRNPQLASSNCINNSTKDLLEEFLILDTKGGISHLAKIGIVNKNSELYRQKCLDSTFYPFSLALAQGRVELIATSYEMLKNWIIGINLLVSNKKQLPKIRQLMELRLD